MAPPGCAALVSDGGDGLSEALAALLRTRGVRALELPAEQLAGTRVALQGERLELDGAHVTAVVFRSSSQADFSAGFEAKDRSFCDAEVRALWLGALHLDGVYAVNRADATAWFEPERWSLWRRRLRAEDLEVVPCELGARDGAGEGQVWLPFLQACPRPLPGAHAERALGCARIPEAPWAVTTVAAGEVVAGPDDDAARRAAQALRRRGVELAELARDERGRVAWVDTLPALRDARVRDAVAEVLAARIEEHVHAQRRPAARLPAG